MLYSLCKQLFDNNCCRHQQSATTGASHQYLQPHQGQGDQGQGVAGELLQQPQPPAETEAGAEEEAGGESPGEQPLRY